MFTIILTGLLTSVLSAPPWHWVWHYLYAKTIGQTPFNHKHTVCEARPCNTWHHLTAPASTAMINQCCDLSATIYTKWNWGSSIRAIETHKGADMCPKFWAEGDNNLYALYYSLYNWSYAASTIIFWIDLWYCSCNNINEQGHLWLSLLENK